MSATPNKRPHKEGGNGSGSGNNIHSSAQKYMHDAISKVTGSESHEYHASYDVGQDSRTPKIQRTESRDSDRRSPLLPMYRVSSNPDDSQFDHNIVSQVHFESKDNNKDVKVKNRDAKPELRDLNQGAKAEKGDKFDKRADDNKEIKHDRDICPEYKGDVKVDKDGFGGTSMHLNWKDSKEQNRGKRYPDVTMGNMDPWHTSRAHLHGSDEVGKEVSNAEDRDHGEAREAVAENKVDLKGQDKFKDKDRKRKDGKHQEWGERDKEKNDYRNNLPLGGSSFENKEILREEKESDKWERERKDLSKERDRPKDHEKEHVERESWNGAEKEVSQNEKGITDVPSRTVELENLTTEQKKQKDHDKWKTADRDRRDLRKERDMDLEGERPEKCSRHLDKESEGGGVDEGSGEREREALNYGVQQCKRMLRPRGSPTENRDPRFRTRSQENEESQGKLLKQSILEVVGS